MCPPSVQHKHPSCYPLPIHLQNPSIYHKTIDPTKYTCPPDLPIIFRYIIYVPIHQTVSSICQSTTCPLIRHSYYSSIHLILIHLTHSSIDPTYICRFDHLIPSTHHMTNTSDHLIYLLTHHIPVHRIIQLSIGPTYNNTSDHHIHLTAYHISAHRAISLPIGPSYINSPTISSICPLTLYPSIQPSHYPSTNRLPFLYPLAFHIPVVSTIPLTICPSYTNYSDHLIYPSTHPTIR